ncbi:MAG: DUF4097 family beta strand repeat protein [Phycisphaerales bacterium]|nr:MAG: DUF4097 family beta strand repeat protein [Phycisphaerales bacterium]
MRKHYGIPVMFGLCMAVIMAMVGCGQPQGRYTRMDNLSAALQPGSAFSAQTHNGSITVRGADVADCNVVATVTARAGMTAEDAQKVAEKVKVTLEPAGAGLAVKIEKPTLSHNQSVAVSLDVTVPNNTDLQITTHNGSIEIAGITGRISGATHNGKVVARKVSGNAALETYNGSVTCREIAGDAQVETHNGHVDVSYSATASPVGEVSITTYNGSIEFAGPPNLSAAVDASTHNGSIRSDLPVVVVGELRRKNQLQGKIGAGEGKLVLRTHNGSIKITK